MKSIAAILTEINKPLQIEELDIPLLKKGQVLVEISYSGICHSQLNEIQGLKGEDKFLPHTLGHEGSGTVVEIGPDVTKVKCGDHVVLTWIKGQGSDVPSAQYRRADGSIINSGAISTFMTHAVISENRLVPITEEMPLKAAALLGCAVPTGAGIVKNTAKMLPGQSIAVLGLGGIGLSAILMAGQMNAKDEKTGSSRQPSIIIAIDIMNQKLALARKLGATHTINANDDDPLKMVMEITSGRGVDYAIEAAGTQITMESALRCVRDKGGLCILAGNLPQGKTIAIDPFDMIKGKQLIGTWGGETEPDRDIPFYETSVLSGRIDLAPLITQIYPLSRINEAIRRMEEGEIGRILIEMRHA